MKKFLVIVTIVAAVLLISSPHSIALTGYLGYSGAPGSSGTCSVSCHYRQHFTPSVVISGFPEYYNAGETYSISIFHQSDRAIKQFNASVRVGNTSQNAGVITDGLNTELYGVSGETNGVHWASSTSDSGSFNWIAPEFGTGEVKLYYAGLQGSLNFGASQSVVLTSDEAITGTTDPELVPQIFSLKQNYPNPFNGQTVIAANNVKPGNYDLSIYNISGQKVYSLPLTSDISTNYNIVWGSCDNNGVPVPSGIYFYTFSGNGIAETKNLMLLR